MSNPPTGRVFIRDLAIECVIGVYEQERHARQPVVLNVVLEIDPAPAAASDDVTQAVDYQDLTDELVAFVGRSVFRLLETLAWQVGDRCLARPDVQAVTVTIDKPNALGSVANVAVEVRRQRA